MNLNQYLKILKQTPDVRLTAETGVYDNFPIITSARYSDLVRIIYSNRAWIKMSCLEDRSAAIHKRLPVMVQVIKGVRSGVVNDLEDIQKIENESFIKQMKTTILLHTYSEHLEDLHFDEERSLAEIITKLTKRLKHRFSFYLPESKGWDHQKEIYRIALNKV